MTEKMIDTFLMRTYLETIQNFVGPNGLKSDLHFGHLETYIDNFPSGKGELVSLLKTLKHCFVLSMRYLGRRAPAVFHSEWAGNLDAFQLKGFLIWPMLCS
ncbi:MAG: hypothetical protein HXS42_02700 [Theionarchaea archaeon]|nr:hypothetical protein [Theionarchaea archaeon]